MSERIGKDPDRSKIVDLEPHEYKVNENDRDEKSKSLITPSGEDLKQLPHPSAKEQSQEIPQRQYVGLNIKGDPTARDRVDDSLLYKKGILRRPKNQNGASQSESIRIRTEKAPGGADGSRRASDVVSSAGSERSEQVENGSTYYDFNDEGKLIFYNEAGAIIQMTPERELSMRDELTKIRRGGSPTPGMPILKFGKPEEIQSNASERSERNPEQSKSSPEPRNAPYSEEELADAKKNLSNFLGSIDASEDRKRDLEARIAIASEPDHVRELAREMRRIQNTSENRRQTEATAKETPVLDPAKFQRILNSANWTGRGEQGIFFEHPDAPGRQFTEQETDAIIAQATRQPDRPSEPIPPSANPAQVQGLQDWAAQADEDPTASHSHRVRGITPEIVGTRAQRPGEPTAEELARQLRERNDRRRDSIDRSRNRGRPRQGPADVVDAGRKGGPQLPRWAGGYGASWAEFDPSLYNDYKLLSMPEIRSNPLHQQLLGELMTAVDPSKMRIFEKLINNTPLSPDERRFAGFVQYELSKNIEQSEWIEKNLSSTELELMMSKDEDFRFFVAQNGVDRTTAAFKERIFHKANQNKQEFESFYRSLKNLKDNQKTERAQRAEAKTKEFCDQYGIKRERYGDFVDLSTKASRRQSEQRLANHIHEHASKFRRGIDWIEERVPLSIPIAGSSRSAALHAIIRENLRNPDKFRWADPRSWVTGDRGGIAENRQNMLDFLVETVSDTEFRHAIEREAFLDEKVVSATESGPKTMEEVRASATGINSTASIKNRIRQYAQGVPNWDTMPIEERTNAIRNLKTAENAGRTKGMGFLAWISYFLFGKNWDDAASSELGKPVHV